MESPTPYQNYLTVLQDGKGIPYFGSQRPNGDINHGFKSLKGNADAIKEIPEAQADSALAALLTKVNGATTGLFTVGCLSADVEKDGGFRVTGYVEFAINDKRHVEDAMPYFQIFFHFTQKLLREHFSEKVQFIWELLGASFADANCDGLTCRVVVNSHFYPTRDEARNCWNSALAVLGDHLASVPAVGRDRLY